MDRDHCCHGGDVMEILDAVLVNVSIRHIPGNMGAAIEEGTWVVTSYLVSNAIILPMAGQPLRLTPHSAR